MNSGLKPIFKINIFKFILRNLVFCFRLLFTHPGFVLKFNTNLKQYQKWICSTGLSIHN